MKKKILKMLEELCIAYKEYEKIEFYKGFTLENVIEIFDYTWTASGNAKEKNIFVTDIDDAILIYEKTGKLRQIIAKEGAEYIVLARLANYLGQAGY